MTEPEHPDFGPCCACGATGKKVRTIFPLQVKAPVPGTGWGCVACDVPADGALAVMCDACMVAHAKPKQWCVGYTTDRVRADIPPDAEPFDHDRKNHPETHGQPIDN